MWSAPAGVAAGEEGAVGEPPQSPEEGAAVGVAAGAQLRRAVAVVAEWLRRAVVVGEEVQPHLAAEVVAVEVRLHPASVAAVAAAAQPRLALAVAVAVAVGAGALRPASAVPEAPQSLNRRSPRRSASAPRR